MVSLKRQEPTLGAEIDRLEGGRSGCRERIIVKCGMSASLVAEYNMASQIVLHLVVKKLVQQI
jgi:hypothetical protein